MVESQRLTDWHRFGADAIGLHVDELTRDALRFRLDDRECRLPDPARPGRGRGRRRLGDRRPRDLRRDPRPRSAPWGCPSSRAPPTRPRCAASSGCGGSRARRAWRPRSSPAPAPPAPRCGCRTPRFVTGAPAWATWRSPRTRPEQLHAYWNNRARPAPVGPHHGADRPGEAADPVPAQRRAAPLDRAGQRPRACGSTRSAPRCSTSTSRSLASRTCWRSVPARHRPRVRHGLVGRPAHQRPGAVLLLRHPVRLRARGRLEPRRHHPRARGHLGAQPLPGHLHLGSPARATPASSTSSASCARRPATDAGPRSPFPNSPEQHHEAVRRRRGRPRPDRSHAGPPAGPPGSQRARPRARARVLRHGPCRLHR